MRGVTAGRIVRGVSLELSRGVSYPCKGAAGQVIVGLVSLPAAYFRFVKSGRCESVCLKSLVDLLKNQLFVICEIQSTSCADVNIRPTV